MKNIVVENHGVICCIMIGSSSRRGLCSEIENK